MNERRNFLKLSASALIFPATASADPEMDDCQIHAENLARAMKRRHGREAIVVIDHDAAVAQIIIV